METKKKKVILFQITQAMYDTCFLDRKYAKFLVLHFINLYVMYIYIFFFCIHINFKITIANFLFLLFLLLYIRLKMIWWINNALFRLIEFQKFSKKLFIFLREGARLQLVVRLTYKAWMSHILYRQFVFIIFTNTNNNI